MTYPYPRAGSVPAGLSPPDVGAPAAPLGSAGTPLFDLAIKNFRWNKTAGRLVAVHPVDAKVCYALGVKRGSIASVPTFGVDYTKLSRMNPDQKQVAADDFTRQALADLLTAGDITIVSIVVGGVIPGRDEIAVSYINNRTAQRQSLTVG